MTALYLYDDARARTFEPFASSRPISEMRAGIALIRERWMVALQGVDEVYFLAGERHADFDESGLRLPGALSAARAATGVIPAGSIVANARCVPAVPADVRRQNTRSAACSMWRGGNQLAAVRTKEPIATAAFADGTFDLETLAAGTGSIGDVGGWWIDEVWDFIRHLPEQLTADIEAMHKQELLRRPASLPDHVTRIGDAPIVVASAATIEPHVVLDASAGPIYIEDHAHVRAFSRITGPCYIGPHVQIMGGDITTCSLGEHAKIRGEISSTVVLGYSNKGHDGFVGHSYLGRWVNLGASTVTSNLKNTYGSVALWTPSGVRDTGMQFLGTMFGDHAKTGIGLRLTTGTVLGAGANVYENMPPKVVSPFSWGGKAPYAVYRADKFVETAERMMSRRHVTLSDQARRHLMRMHAERWMAESGET